MFYFVSFMMFNFSYLFSVLFLGFLVLFMMLFYLSNVMFVKYLVILVYISGIVVFILYISCMCWNSSDRFNKFFLLWMFFSLFFFDSGLFSKFSDVSEYLWMYLFFSFLFNGLVMSYSLNLFKISGSLRF